MLFFISWSMWKGWRGKFRNSPESVKAGLVWTVCRKFVIQSFDAVGARAGAAVAR